MLSEVVFAVFSFRFTLMLVPLYPLKTSFVHRSKLEHCAVQLSTQFTFHRSRNEFVASQNGKLHSIIIPHNGSHWESQFPPSTSSFVNYEALEHPSNSKTN